jgi:hypothetical protein
MSRNRIAPPAAIKKEDNHKNLGDIEEQRLENVYQRQGPWTKGKIALGAALRNSIRGVLFFFRYLYTRG